LLDSGEISDEFENDDCMNKEDMIHENLEMKSFINENYDTYDWKKRKWNEVNKTHSNERSIECPMSVAQIFSGGYLSKKLIEKSVIPVICYKKKGGNGSISQHAIGPLIDYNNNLPYSLPHYFSSSSTYQKCYLDYNRHNSSTWATKLEHITDIILRLPEKNYLSTPWKPNSFDAYDPLSEFVRVRDGQERVGIVFYPSGGNPAIHGSNTPNPNQKLSSACAIFEHAQYLSSKNTAMIHAALEKRLVHVYIAGNIFPAKYYCKTLSDEIGNDKE